MPDYQQPDIETDAGALKESLVDRMLLGIPGLAIQDGHPLNFILEAVAEIDSDLFLLLAARFDEGFASIGTNLWRKPPRTATQATSVATIVRIDDTGDKIIPAGTQITLAGADGGRVGFQTRNEVTILDGFLSTSIGEVEIIASDAGAAGTGLQADPQLEDAAGWIDTITIEAPTAGGEDAEDTEEYLNRLADTGPDHTLVVAADFERDARNNVDQVERALALDLYQAAVNEIQQVNVANATGGTATYTFEGQTTAAVAATANAATFQAALEALSNIAPGDVIVTGGPLNTAPVFVEFTGTLAGANRTQMTFTSSLTGGSASLTISTTRGGQAAVPSTAGTLSVAVVNTDGDDPGSVVRATGQARQEDLAAAQLTVTWIAATYTTITVVFAAKTYAQFDPADVEARAEEAVLEFLSPARWGLPPFGDTRAWVDSPTVRYRDVVAAIESVEGLDYTTSVTVNGGTADVTLTGPAALPSSSSTASGTVTAP